MKLFPCLVYLLSASDAAKNRGRKGDKNELGLQLQSQWAHFTATISSDLTSHMKCLDCPNWNIKEILPNILAAYQDDHPETEDKIKAMKKSEYDPEAEGETDEKTNGPRKGALRSGAGSMDGLTDQDKMHMMKYLQLKYTILFLQKNKFIGKYCFYGCWCLPAGAGFDKQGFGLPVDNIDKSCREFTTCYNCLYNPAPFQGENCNEMDAMQKRYNIQGSADPNTGVITLFCMDPQGSCLRSRCECDKSLSEKLSEHESEWNMQHHHKWGNPAFVPSQMCGSNLATPQQEAAAADGAVAGSFVGPSDGASKLSFSESKKDQVVKLTQILQAVSQAESERHPNGDFIINVQKGPGKAKSPVTVVQSAPIYGAIIGCCGRAPNVHYYRDGQRCCVDGEIVDVQAPCSMDFL